MTIGTLANRYHQTNNYQKARDNYRKVIKLSSEPRAVDQRQISSNLATTYQQLGIIAQELREYGGSI